MTDDQGLSPNELAILRHALGMNEDGRGRPFRNHFCAGGEDVAACRGLAAKGLMDERQPTHLTGGDPWFVVTAAGERAAQPAPGGHKVGESLGLSEHLPVIPATPATDETTSPATPGVPVRRNSQERRGFEARLRCVLDHQRLAVILGGRADLDHTELLGDLSPMREAIVAAAGEALLAGDVWPHAIRALEAELPKVRPFDLPYERGFAMGFGRAIGLLKEVTSATSPAARADVAPGCSSSSPDARKGDFSQHIEDLRLILRALGLFDGARSQSAHEVVHHEVLPAIAQLKEGAHGWLIQDAQDMYWTGHRLDSVTRNIDEAVRCARFEDAERLRCWLVSSGQHFRSVQASTISRPGGPAPVNQQPGDPQ